MKYHLFPLLVIFFASNSLLMAQPVLNKSNLQGIQIGASTDLTLSGQGLKKGTRVFLPFPCSQQMIVENGSRALTVRLQLADSIKPGLYPLRVVNEDGVSEPILIGVDRLPQKGFDSAKQSLPVALSGNLAGARILKTSFSASKDNLVVLEIEANRLGGKLRPVIHLYDDRGRQVAFGQPSRFLGGDARCFLRIPKDGEYFIELHDFLYRGASPGFFRLKVGAFEYADLTLPVGLMANKPTPIRLIKIDAESEFLEEMKLAERGWHHARLSKPEFSGALPQVFSSGITEFVEMSQSDKPVKVGKVPVGINGRISSQREVDKFLVDVEPNSKLTFDLLGRRLGSPIDAKIRIANVAGNTLAQNDDRKGEQDALVNYTVPGNVKQLVVEVSDIASAGSKSHVYRLTVLKQNRPQVTATIGQRTLNIPQGGKLYVPVNIVRKNYSGPIQLLFQGLPQNVKVSGAKIPAGSDRGLLTLSSTAKDPVFFTMQAKIQVGEQIDHFDVLGPEAPYCKGMSVLRKQFAIATVGSKRLELTWQTDSESLSGYLGGKLTPAFAIQRGENVKGPIRVRLITDQKIPKKRIRKNNKDTFVDDVEKTIRATPVELVDQKTDSSLAIQIPNAIEEREWTVLLVAELLSADKKRVLLSSATRSIKLATQRLAIVQLKQGKIINLPRTGTAKFQVSGTIQRMGEPLPCRIAVNGLPKGVKVVPAMVDGNTDEFDVTLNVPVNAELLKLKSLSLSFDFLLNGDPNQVVGKAKDQRVKVKVMPAPKQQPDQKKKSDEKKK